MFCPPWLGSAFACCRPGRTEEEQGEVGSLWQLQCYIDWLGLHTIRPDYQQLVLRLKKNRCCRIQLSHGPQYSRTSHEDFKKKKNHSPWGLPKRHFCHDLHWVARNTQNKILKILILSLEKNAKTLRFWNSTHGPLSPEGRVRQVLVAPLAGAQPLPTSGLTRQGISSSHQWRARLCKVTGLWNCGAGPGHDSLDSKAHKAKLLGDVSSQPYHNGFLELGNGDTEERWRGTLVHHMMPTLQNATVTPQNLVKVYVFSFMLPFKLAPRP